MGYNGAEVMPAGANILHHCNTGALATVDFGTALGVIYACHEQGKNIHVWVDETRPRLQGARLTAWELMRAEVPMHLIADNAAGHLMRTGQVDVVLFGADRVAANGDVANKIGTYKLGVVAKENGIPVYAVVPTSTIDLSLASGDEIPIEERGPEEVTQIGDAVDCAGRCAGLQPGLRRDAAPLFDGHRYGGRRVLSAVRGKPAPGERGGARCVCAMNRRAAARVARHERAGQRMRLLRGEHGQPDPRT